MMHSPEINNHTNIFGACPLQFQLPWPDIQIGLFGLLAGADPLTSNLP